MKLRDIAKVYGGYAFKSSKFQENGIPIIRIGNLDGENVNIDKNICYPVDFADEHPEYLIDRGDVLVAMSGATVGKIGVFKSDEKSLLNQRVGNIKSLGDVDSGIIYYYCISPAFKRLIQKEAFGCAQPNISAKKLENFEIEIPETNMHKQVIETLDKVSTLITNKKKQLQEYDQLIKSRFVEMFGDPIINDKGFKVSKLKELSQKIRSGTTPKGGRQVYVDEGITFFRSQNVWKNKIDFKDIAFIDKETHSKMSESSLKHKDILMTKTGRINTENSSLGRAAMYLGEDDKANVNGHVYLIRMNNIAISEFVLYIITTIEYRDYIRSVCVGGIDKRQLNKNHIEDFPIILPPREQQEDFVKLVNQVDKLKFTIQKSLDETQILFDSLMQEYFG